MSDFDSVELRKLDLTVLLIFLGLMRHRKAARVAEEIGLTPSSVSHALGRLRETFGDPLFLRRPHGLEPTATAQRLEPRIRAAVEELDAALRPAEPFDPANDAAVLRVTAHDNEIAGLAPALVAALPRQAPHMQLIFSSRRQADALVDLSERRADVALGFFRATGRDIMMRPLMTQGYRVVGRAGHPAMQGVLDLDGYAEAAHVLVTQAGDLRGVVDDVLRRHGRSRRVVAAFPAFLAALAAVRESDALLTLPERIAAVYAPVFGLDATEPPVPLRRFTVSAAIHRRDETDPVVTWFLGFLATIARASEE